MALGAIYLWQPEIFTGTVPDIHNSERAAYELYQQYRGTVSEGNALQLWIDHVVTQVTSPKYSEFFSEHVQNWAIKFQQAVKSEPYAIVELEHFDIFAQGDALYRVFYEAVKVSGVGFYEPMYAVWGMGNIQIPTHAVETILKSTLKPLSTESQTFNLENISPPRNIKKAEELVRLWSTHHPYAKYLTLHIYNIGYDFIHPWGNTEHPEQAPDKGYRNCLWTDERTGIFYQFKMLISSLTKSPMVSFAMDLTNHFIPEEQQGLLKERLIFRFSPQDLRTHLLSKYGKLELKYYLTGCWDNQHGIQGFFEDLDGYLSFIFSNLGAGNLRALQAWAYGDMPEDLIIELSYKDKMMIYTLSLDQNSLTQCYAEYKKECAEKEYAKQEHYDKELSCLESNYLMYQDIMALIREAGTALPSYQKVNK